MQARRGTTTTGREKIKNNKLVERNLKQVQIKLTLCKKKKSSNNNR
jgi:hypothetical protein